MFKKNHWKVTITIVVLISSYTLYSAMSIWLFSYKNQLVETDAAIVLGAAVWDNLPSPVLRERIDHAIWLYKKGYVKKIIFTGGKAHKGELAESEVARIYAVDHGVPVNDTYIESHSKITEENLENAKGIANDAGLDTFTIVSDPLHMKRSVLMANQLGMNVYSSPTPSSVYKSLETKLPFLVRETFFYIGYKLSMPFR